MQFNFQKNPYDREHISRVFSFKEFYEKCVLPYRNVSKDDSPQFHQGVLKNKRATISMNNIAFLNCLTLDYDAGFENTEIVQLRKRLEKYDLSFIFYDTASSKNNNRRFRLILPIGVTVNTNEYKLLAKTVNSLLVQLPIDEQAYSATQRFRLANRSSHYHDGNTLSYIINMQALKRKASTQQKNSGDANYKKKVENIPAYICSLYSLNAEGNRNAELNKAIFLAVKLGGTESDLMEIASNSSLPEKEKSYIIKRNLKNK